MKRAFITFSEGDHYNKLTEYLKQTLDKFSNYDLVVYKLKDLEDLFKVSESDWSGEGEVKQNSQNFSQHNPIVYIYKILSCIKALEYYDEIVWIDTDCIVNHNIDDVWNRFKDVEDYPLLPKYKNYMWINSPHHISDVRDPDFNKNGKEYFEIESVSDDSFYLQACFMLINKNCLGFLEEVVRHFDNFNAELFPCGDETIINLMLWKYKKTNNLGNNFLCSYYFGYSLDLFINLNGPEEFTNLCSLIPKDNNYNEILFFHGTKDIEVTNYLTDKLMSRY
jgi:hypothetical protein